MYQYVIFDIDSKIKRLVNARQLSLASLAQTQNEPFSEVLQSLRIDKIVTYQKRDHHRQRKFPRQNSLRVDG